MSEIKVDTVGPRVDSGTLTIGAAGDTVNIAGTAGTGFPAGTTINNNADNKVITGSGTAGTLNGETNFIYNGTIVGCGADGANADLGTGVHIKRGDSGATANGNADQLVLENADATNSGNTGMSFLGSGNGRICFGDAADDDVGRIMYSHGSSNYMNFKTNATEAVRIHSNQVVSAVAGVALGVGTANTASNVLDDYEFGDFTPTWTAVGSGSITGTPTNFAKYVKSGRQVTVSVSTIFQTSGTFTDYRLDNLPFTQSMIGAGSGVEYGQQGVGLMIQGVNSSTQFFVKRYDAAFIANAYIMVNYTYITTS